MGVRYSEGEGVPKDEKEAFKWFSKAADQNYPPALYSLAVMYYEGIEVKRDVKKALELLHASASLGDPEAEKFLEEIEEDGENC